MGDKDALNLLQKKLRESLAWRERVKAEAASAAVEVEEEKSQEGE